MKMFFRLLGILAISASGCKSVVVSGTAMRVNYTLGRSEAQLAESPEQVFNATRLALKDLEIEAEGRRDKLSGQLSGTLADGKVLEINVTKLNPAGTSLTIKIGDMADAGRSTAILEAIKKRL